MKKITMNQYLELQKLDEIIQLVYTSRALPAPSTLHYEYVELVDESGRSTFPYVLSGVSFI